MYLAFAAPQSRVVGFAVLTDFEIQGGHTLAPAIANCGDGFAGIHSSAYWLEQALIAPIQILAIKKFLFLKELLYLVNQ